MQTQTFYQQMSQRKPSFAKIAMLSVIASVVLLSGFMFSLILMAVSAIIFPFVAFKLWRLQRQHQKDISLGQAAVIKNGEIIDAEYTVVDEPLK
ncbi:hypothetical protein GCM10009133_08610 [Cocleimonas flava]|uniref:Uncharacterized protein n=1 Tax=Cocleimonas flava TaxID=634765 RepID=A0A4R1F0D7_9GAMM|nr:MULTISPECIES: hypothetical protein [Cocleimonas]MEB8431914.1 hypothetical protein [Cocleimonas sp. KMM 6892]MEC4715000.1 hypothetical protein [Cocleimonas sp. KMM 6895]MEC4744186.1 hypothetical protein [Cocleimonas sp. KMM 6896]TCJ87223.1 hypothetical protein EV695_1731 [Cocleimonas flava]